MTFKEFASRMQRVIESYPKYEAEAASILGVALVEKAQNKIGHLQNGGEFFPAWEPLKESTIADKKRQGYFFQPDGNPLYRTGSLKEHISHVFNWANHVLYIGSPDLILQFQEEGTVHIPARSVLHSTMFQAEPLAEVVFQHMLKNWITQKPLTNSIITPELTKND